MCLLRNKSFIAKYINKDKTIKYYALAMEMSQTQEQMFGAAVFLLVFGLVWRLLWTKWWQPGKVEAALRRQGIKGPPLKLRGGGTMAEILRMRFGGRKKNIQDRLSHDIVAHVLPDVHSLSKKYGMPYLYWWGTEPRLTTTDPEIIRGMLSKKPEYFGKSSSIQAGVVPLLGYGLVAANGDDWAQHRRVVAPAFHLEKLKGMVETMVNCASKMLDKWDKLVKEQAEIDVNEEFSVMAADVISHTAFGSSYEKGQRVFELLNMQAELLAKITFSSNHWLPFNRVLPTSINRALWKVQKELNDLLLELVQERRDSVKHGRCSSHGQDLLGLMLAESDGGDRNNPAFSNEKLVGECKTFYVAGQETTAQLLTWTTFLLAINPEWQERARAEVIEVCKDGNPNADMLSKLKLVGMILNETARLYPPVPVIQRGTFQDAHIANLYIPKGVVFSIPILALHHDKEYWGADANEFKPQRFSEGVSRACKHPNAFMPFSFGPRVCVGQTFALNEAKIATAMILRKYSFSLSPDYRHCPATGVTLKPHHGMQIIFKKL